MSYYAFFEGGWKDHTSETVHCSEKNKKEEEESETVH